MDAIIAARFSADIGLIGLGASLAALIGWLLATRTTLALTRRRVSEAWTPERTGLLALAAFVADRQ